MVDTEAIRQLQFYVSVNEKLEILEYLLPPTRAPRVGDVVYWPNIISNKRD